MKTILAILLALLAAPYAFAEIPVDILAAIAKAKSKPSPVVVTPPPVVPASAPAAVEWSSYEDAYALHKENDLPLVVLVSASWCGPCKLLKEAIEKEAIGGLNYAYVDVDESPEIVKLLGFTGQFNIPQLRIYYPEPMTANHEQWTGERLSKDRPKLFEAFRKAARATKPRNKDL